MRLKKKVSEPTTGGRTNITEAQQTLGALLRLPYQFLTGRVYGHLARTDYADLRPAHSAVFRYIVPDGSRITELAEKAQMTKQSMGYLVEYLRDHGYVELQDDPADGRAKRVYLTTRGVSAQQAAIERSRQVEGEMAALVGEDQMRDLRRLLEQLMASLSQIEGGDDNGKAGR